MSWDAFATPNPGSAAALAEGCLCAVLDNCHGVRQPRPDGWWVTLTCPLHGQQGDPT
jgi:hypothetical protein